METKKIDSFEAYMSMFTFLENLYDEKQDDDLGAILGDLHINPNDNQPNDPGMKQMWFRTIDNFSASKTEKFTYSEAYSIMLKFLEALSSNIDSDSLKKITLDLYTNSQNEVIIEKWCLSITNVLNLYR